MRVVSLWVTSSPDVNWRVSESRFTFFEPTCAYCTVGSYASLSVRPSVRLSVYHWIKIHISANGNGIFALTGTTHCRQRQVAFLCLHIISKKNCPNSPWGLTCNLALKLWLGTPHCVYSFWWFRYGVSERIYSKFVLICRTLSIQNSTHNTRLTR